MKISITLLDGKVLTAEAGNIIMDPQAWAPMIHFQGIKKDAAGVRDVKNLISVHQNQIVSVIWSA